jgi:hypothetical protein
MIQRIGIVLISLIISSAAYAVPHLTPVSFTHACEKLLTQINSNVDLLNLTQMSSFAHETFEDTRELSVIQKQFAFIKKVSAKGLSAPERTKLCMKEIQDNFQES